jgi:dTMP kinase
VKPIDGGWFVTFEGPEGSGKTIQAARIRDLAEAAGLPVVLTREPGGTAVGELIRNILMAAGQDAVALGPRTDALLFNAARAQHVDDVIRPALARGALVICARYADSTIAYQGYGSGLPLPALRELERLATDGLRPDLTILLDLPVEVGLARKAGDEQQRFEAGMDLAYHRRVRDGFRMMAADEPDRFVVVDAGVGVADVFDQTRLAISRLPGLAALASVPVGAGLDEPQPPALRMNR